MKNGRRYHVVSAFCLEVKWFLRTHQCWHHAMRWFIDILATTPLTYKLVVQNITIENGLFELYKEMANLSILILYSRTYRFSVWENYMEILYGYLRLNTIAKLTKMFTEFFTFISISLNFRRNPSCVNYSFVLIGDPKLFIHERTKSHDWSTETHVCLKCIKKVDSHLHRAWMI